MDFGSRKYVQKFRIITLPDTGQPICEIYVDLNLWIIC
jgi:hypothetical protein